MSKPTVEQLLCEELADKIDRKFYPKSPARKREPRRDTDKLYSSQPVEYHYRKKAGF